MTNIQLDKLSVSELEKLKGGIDQTIERKRVIELLSLREKIDELIHNSPFTLEEVIEAKASKLVLPKYQHPGDPSQTWTGRGRKPKWVEAFLDEGKTLEELAI